MPAVVIQNRRHFEARPGSSPWAVEHARDYHFLPFIEIRDRTIRIRVQVVLRSVVAVEVRGGVDGLAEGVIRHDRGRFVELLLDFDNAALIKGGRRRSVLVVLRNDGE